MNQTPLPSPASPTAPRTAGLSRPKKLLFSCIALVLGYGLIEAVAAGWLLARYGELKQVRTIQTNIKGQDLEAIDRVQVDALHPYQGYVHYPVQDLRHRDAVHMTEWGYEDTAPPLRKRGDNQVVVAILGGSVAAQFASGAKDRLAAALTEDPRFRGRQFDFVHLAIGGYKQPQQLMQITYLLTLGGEFDLVLNLDGFNEVALSIAENYENGIFPSYPREWDSRVRTHQSWLALRTIGRTVILEDQRRLLAARFSAFPWKYSFAATSLWDAWDQHLQQGVLEALHGYRALLSQDRSAATSGPFHPFATESELYRHCIDVWQRSSLQLHELCAAHGITYYHFLQPNQYVADSKPFSQQEKLLAINPQQPYRIAAETGYPLLIEAGRQLRARGVRFHDLTQVFMQHPETVYKDDCCHLNPAGNAILADAMATFIREHP